MMKNRWVEYVGIAINSIEYKNQRELHILCPELLPLVTGGHTRANIKSSKYTVKHSDILTGTQYEKDINLTESIVAEWLGDTNHDVPDIHEGEQIRVLNYGGLDRFWWLPYGRHDNIRRTEHLKLYVADKELSLKELTDDNSWFLEFDTKYDKKRFKLSTSKSDGEDYRYFFTIDAVNNTVELTDDSGNYFFLDSSKPKIILHNRTNTYIELDDADLNINVPRNLNIKVGNDVKIDVAGDVINNIGEKVDTASPPTNTPSKSNSYTRSPTNPFYPTWKKGQDPAPAKLETKPKGNVTSTIAKVVKTEIGEDRSVRIMKEDKLEIMGSRIMAVTNGVSDSTAGTYKITTGATINLVAGANVVLKSGGKFSIKAAEIVGGSICKIPLGRNRID